MTSMHRTVSYWPVRFSRSEVVKLIRFASLPSSACNRKEFGPSQRQVSRVSRKEANLNVAGGSFSRAQRRGTTSHRQRRRSYTTPVIAAAVLPTRQQQYRRAYYQVPRSNSWGCSRPLKLRERQHTRRLNQSTHACHILVWRQSSAASSSAAATRHRQKVPDWATQEDRLTSPLYLRCVRCATQKLSLIPSDATGNWRETSLAWSAKNNQH